MTTRARLTLTLVALVLLALVLTEPGAMPPRDERTKVLKFRQVA